MMLIFREIGAVAAFVLAVCFLSTAIFDGIDVLSVLVGILGLLVAYFVWPSKRRGHQRNSHWLLDALEVLIELPGELFFWFLRAVLSIIKLFDLH